MARRAMVTIFTPIACLPSLIRSLYMMAELNMASSIRPSDAAKSSSDLGNFDKYQLLEIAKKEIQRIYTFMKGDEKLSITISGHTDSVGSEAYNQNLSKQRAKAVANYLEQLGLPKEQIVWQGRGGLKPIASNSSEEGRKLNRRVEFVVSKKDN